MVNYIITSGWNGRQVVLLLRACKRPGRHFPPVICGEHRLFRGRRGTSVRAAPRALWRASAIFDKRVYFHSQATWTFSLFSPNISPCAAHTFTGECHCGSEELFRHDAKFWLCGHLVAKIGRAPSRDVWIFRYTRAYSAQRTAPAARPGGTVQPGPPPGQRRRGQPSETRSEGAQAGSDRSLQERWETRLSSCLITHPGLPQVYIKIKIGTIPLKSRLRNY